jgi:aspartyl/asparaginyl beta-hydroxylase (cupin superfamily)
VFDDTIEHEAMNEADAQRTVLIFDVWNPFLSEAEKTLVSAMMTARRAYEAEG